MSNNDISSMTIESIITESRYLNSKMSNRVLYLLKQASCTKVFSDTMINYLRLAKITNDTVKYRQLLEKIELHLLKNSSLNFVIYNIPEYATVSSTQSYEKVGYSHIRDTLEQFGKLNTFDFISGTVYSRFVDPSVPEIVHNAINNMIINNQVIRTLVV